MRRPTPDADLPLPPPAPRAAVLLLALAVAVACGEEAIQGPRGDHADSPGPEAGRTVLPRLTLTGASPDADIGDTLELGIRLRRRPGGMTPTGYAVTLRHDPDLLEPIEAVGRDGPGLSVVNAAAGPGRVRAAGAAPDGLADGELVTVRMRVRGPGWRRTLRLDVGSLDVLERGFADVAPEIGPVRPGRGGGERAAAAAERDRP